QASIGWLANLLASYFGTVPSVVNNALKDSATCSGGSAMGTSTPIADASRIFPVDAKGIPLSTNPIWNACIRRTVTISASTLEPYSCSRYHVAQLWQHPDTHVAFKWSDVYRKQLEIVDHEPVLILSVRK
ncbi:MAG: hypothetical protein PHO54_02390, partial [Candidatus Peribacteraceae bacterium]|nr:hypothetical protein [Candidatus Peribacteraceae bacterium]